jgi:hypothetical protein
MGKHEREIVEEAEKIIVKLINKVTLTSLEEKHEFINLIVAFSKKIKEEYPNIVKSEHIGNSYNSLGDISIFLKNGNQKFIELKFLESGFGTLANISQNALTELNIFKTRSWSSFREEKNHSNKIIEYLNKYNYPNGKIKNHDSKNKIYEKADFLKKIIESGTKNVEPLCKKIILDKNEYSEEKKLAAEIILKIINFDKEIKLEYMKLLKESFYDEEKLKLFCFLILTGTHTIKDIQENISKNVNLLLKNISNYEIYYLYKKNNQILKEDNLEFLKRILNNKIGIRIEDNQTNLIIYSENTKKENIIRIVFHWKNKFQGIQTPCLNIFKI